jgi:hypothetical protein
MWGVDVLASGVMVAGRFLLRSREDAEWCRLFLYVMEMMAYRAGLTSDNAYQLARNRLEDYNPILARLWLDFLKNWKTEKS